MQSPGDVSNINPKAPTSQPQKRKAAPGNLSGRQVKPKVQEGSNVLQVHKKLPEETAVVLEGKSIKTLDSTIVLLKADLESVAEDLMPENRELATLIRQMAESINSEADLQEVAAHLLTFLFINETKLSTFKHILVTLLLLPERNRVGALTHVLSIFRGISDTDAREAIVDVLKDMPGEIRSAVIAQAGPVCQKLSFYPRLGLLRLLPLVPQEQRKGAAGAAALLLQDISDELLIKDIIRAFVCFPQDNRASMLASIVSLFKGMPDYRERLELIGMLELMPSEHTRLRLLSLISEIPQEQRKSAPGAVALLLQDISDELLIKDIIRAFVSLPEDDRVSMLASIVSLFKSLPDYRERLELIHMLELMPSEHTRLVLLRLLSLIPQGQRKSAAIPVALLLKDITDELLINDISRAFVCFPPDKRVRMLASIVSLFKGLPDYRERLEHIRMWEVLPLAPEQHASLMNNIPSRDLRLEIFNALETLPQNQRANWFGKLSHLLSGRLRSDIILALEDAPKEQLIGVLEHIHSLFSITEADEVFVKDIIQASSSLPQEQRAAAYKGLLSTLNAIPLYLDRVTFIRAFALLPQEFEKVASVLKKIPSSPLREDILMVLKELPQEDRAKMFDTIVSEFQKIPDLTLRAEIIFTLTGVPKKERAAYFVPIASMSRDFYRVPDRKDFVTCIVMAILFEHMQDVARHSAFLRMYFPERNLMEPIIRLVGNMEPEHREALCQRLVQFSSQFAPEYRYLPVSVLNLYQITPIKFFNWFEVIVSQELKLSLLQALNTELRPYETSQVFSRLCSISPQVAEEVNEYLGVVESSEEAEVDDSSSNQGCLEIAREDIAKHPLDVLDAVCGWISEVGLGILAVRFIGEEGIDEGGLGRHLVSELFSHAVTLLKFEPSKNGLYRPKLSMQHNLFQPLSREEKRAYNQLGFLLLFCLQADKDYPIGMLFDKGFFVGLIELAELSDKDFDSLISDSKMFDALFAIFAHMNQNDEEQKRMIASMRESLKTATDEDKNQMAENILRPALSPMFEIAKGMKQAAPNMGFRWQLVKEMPLVELSKKLQGVVSKELILEKLDFLSNVKSRKRQWIREWIQNADEKKLQRFLFALSGAYALGRSARIKIDEVTTEGFAFHTCHNSLDLPKGINDKRKFIETLEWGIAFTGFSTD